MADDRVHTPTLTLTLKRGPSSDKSTIGELFFGDAEDGHLECYILEDPVRPEKIKHKTAIPAGKYEIIINFSNRFQKNMPLLLNVPNYKGIRIHPGNTAKDTSGCLLPGTSKGIDFVGQSRKAYSRLLDKIRFALQHGKVFIDILSPEDDNDVHEDRQSTGGNRDGDSVPAEHVRRDRPRVGRRDRQHGDIGTDPDPRVPGAQPHLIARLFGFLFRRTR